MSKTSKMFILRKSARKLKNISLLHFMSTLHNFSLKIETEWGKKVVKPISETKNVIYSVSDKKLKQDAMWKRTIWKTKFTTKN